MLKTLGVDLNRVDVWFPIFTKRNVDNQQVLYFVGDATPDSVDRNAAVIETKTIEVATA